MGHYKQNSYSGSLYSRHYRSGVSNSTHTTMCSKQNHQKQTMTIIWHVDDLKISHVEKYVLVFILSKFNENFWKSKPTDDKMGKSPRIPRHNNRLQAKKEGKILHVQIIRKLLEELAPEIRATAKTPASYYLLNTNPEINS